MYVYATDRLTDREGAWELLAHAAQRAWGFSRLPEPARTPTGKPFFPDHPDCCFNLSHSGHCALCALDQTPVGADIQVVKRTWRAGLSRRVCAPAELDWLERQTDYWIAFTQLWCLKEARVKYTGAGLGAGARETVVPLPEIGKTLYQLDGLWFRLYTGPDFCAAVCGENPPPENIIWI